MGHFLPALAGGGTQPPDALTRRHVYEWIGNQLRSDILENADRLQAIDADICRNFVDPLRTFDSYEVVRLAGDAGFEIDPIKRVVRVNQAPLDLLVREVVRYRPQPDKPTARGIKRILVEAFFLHEIVHLPQGIGNFGDVQHVKRNIGVHVIGSLDLIADVRGARTLARVQTIRQGGSWDPHYFFYLLQNLVIIGEFAVKAFGAPLSKPHKIWRALGLACMAALVHHQLRRRDPGRVAIPTDCILQPVFSEAMDSISLLALTPELKVLHANIPIHPQQLAALAERVDEGQFLRCVVAMGQILKRAGIII